MLMAGHYLTAMVVALLCAALYHKIGIDLGSFQCVLHGSSAKVRSCG